MTAAYYRPRKLRTPLTKVSGCVGHSWKSGVVECYNINIFQIFSHLKRLLKSVDIRATV